MFSVNESNTLLSDFPAHESSVLRLSWSHPKFGNLLATGGSEGVVKIWKEDSRHNWSPVYQQDTFNAPVTALSWSPQQIGFNLLSASADGCVSILTFFGGSSWENAKFFAHEGGVLSAVWSPEIYSTLLANDNDQFTKCFVSGGVDGTIKLWRSEEG